MSLIRSIFLVIILVVTSAANGAGLQVTPIVLNIKQTQKSDGLWLTNTSNQPMDVQVRVFEWLQQNQTDVLNPTPEFVASPPLVKIPSGQKQFVRLVRVGQKADSGERAYRIVVDELPLERANARGLTFALRYSIPVFIQGSDNAAPALTWALRRGAGGEATLSISNSGATRARLSGVKFVNSNGQSVSINQGLFGYVLANSSRQWILPKSANFFAKGGIFEVKINEKHEKVPVTGFR